MLKRSALSGNAAPLALNSENSTDTGSIGADGQDLEQDLEQKDVEIASLKQFLSLADKAENAEELLTLTDDFAARASDLTNKTADFADKITDFAGRVTEQDLKRGIIAAKLFTPNCTSPTGAQVISTLELNASDLEQFAELRDFHITPLFKKLSVLVPKVQEIFGRKSSSFPGASEAADFGGYCGLIDPMKLAEIVPFIETIEDLGESQVEYCFQGFQLLDGYPTIQGKPLWERQEWERIDYFNLYKLYRDMRYAFYNEADILTAPRSLTALAQAVMLAPRTLDYLAKVYHWSIRVSLYDSWMQMMQHRRRLIKQELMLDRHTKIAQALMARAFAVLKRQAEKLSAKEALQMLELALKYERISEGLPGDKPLDVGKSAAVTPLLSIVNQTNTSMGPMQVNQSPTNSEQQLQNSMKKPDTLLSILGVLQQSGALETALNRVNSEAVDMEAVDVEEA